MVPETSDYILLIVIMEFPIILLSSLYPIFARFRSRVKEIRTPNSNVWNQGENLATFPIRLPPHDGNGRKTLRVKPDGTLFTFVQILLHPEKKGLVHSQIMAGRYLELNLLTFLG